MQLAQTNIALFRWPLSDLRMIEFAEQIETINALAEASSGFVWRFDEPYADSAEQLASRAAPFNNPLIFFNMSVWEDVDSLRAFIGSRPHAELMRHSSRWTEPASLHPLAMWWVEDDHRPSVDEAIDRLLSLSIGHQDEQTFTFANPQPPDTD